MELLTFSSGVCATLGGAKLGGKHMFGKGTVGFPLQLLFSPPFLCTNMFKGNPVCRKTHWIVKYLKLKRINQSIELRELVLDRFKFINKALLKETLMIDGLK